MDKLFGYTIKQWARVALDMIDGDDWHDLVYKTGLPEERCKEIMKMYHAASDENWFTLLTGEEESV